jgi:hypothetical protein
MGIFSPTFANNGTMMAPGGVSGGQIIENKSEQQGGKFRLFLTTLNYFRAEQCYLRKHFIPNRDSRSVSVILN